MNILVEELPDFVFIGGRSWAIHTEFYIGVEFELMMQGDSLNHNEKIQEALRLFYPSIPDDLQGAVDALLWFYGCGDEPKEKSGGGGKPSTKKAYCFDQDSNLIYGAFWQAYGIDLNTSNLHWWAFRALFLGMSPEIEIKKIITYRTADLKGLPKAEKKKYEKLRKIYALKNKKSVNSVMSLEQRNQSMKDYIQKRYAEMEAGGNH